MLFTILFVSVRHSFGTVGVTYMITPHTFCLIDLLL